MKIKQYIMLGCISWLSTACASGSIHINNENYSIKQEGHQTQSTQHDTHNTITLINNRTGKEAVVTGQLVVKLGSANTYDIAKKYGLSVAHEFVHLGVVFFTTNGQDIFSLQQVMREDNTIESVNIDIIENKMTPN